jgi:hypothetical protein
MLCPKSAVRQAALGLCTSICLCASASDVSSSFCGIARPAQHTAAYTEPALPSSACIAASRASWSETSAAATCICASFHCACRVDADAGRRLA